LLLELSEVYLAEKCYKEIVFFAESGKDGFLHLLKHTNQGEKNVPEMPQVWLRAPSPRHHPRIPMPGLWLNLAKWLKQRLRVSQAPARKRLKRRVAAALPGWIETTLCYVQSPVRRIDFYARLLLFLGLVFWGLWFIQTDYRQLIGGLPEINYSFMHRVDLVFHEAGDILFIPLGRFMSILGGSLGQLLMPAVVLGVFLFQQRDTFGASVGLWWLAQSCMDLAPYINDARAGELLLLGGVTGRDNPGHHDWWNILSELEWLEYDHALAAMVNLTGEVFMLLAFVWGGWVLWRQYQKLEPRI
jgi:hypothetical protein